jgi:hypothetical protein
VPPAPARTEAPHPVENKPTVDAEAVVDKQLIKPLVKREAKQDRFSRAYIPPQARQVRIIDRQPSTDSRGAQFVAFAVDQRPRLFGSKAGDDRYPLRKDVIVGCVYPVRDEVFIKRGEKFFGAGLLLGQRAPADDSVCRAATTPARASPPPPAAAAKVAAR